MAIAPSTKDRILDAAEALFAEQGYERTSLRAITTAADGAAFAIVMTVTDPDAESPYARASQIIVPTDTPGFRLVRNISVMGDEGGGWASHAEIVYENCRVPQTNVLGEEGAAA